MFYQLLKLYARAAIKIYLCKIIINKPEVLKTKGPVLLAANHPNSFLDGIILTTLFDQPVHSLARGDAFKNKWVNRLLRSIKLLPVYRTSEGVENLSYNYDTFEACQKTFEKREIVLIFSEGRCLNEWHLRPLKKGTARLSIAAWENGLPLKVIPVAFNYSSFKKFGKTVHLYFGEEIPATSVLHENTEGKKLLQFNEFLRTELQAMVYEIDPHDQKTAREVFSVRKKNLFFLLIPAISGWLLHLPLYYSCLAFVHWYFKNSEHYDSVMTSLLLLFYPFYLLLFLLIAFSLISWAALLTLLILPLTAWAAVRLKYQLGR